MKCIICGMGRAPGPACKLCGMGSSSPVSGMGFVFCCRECLLHFSTMLEHSGPEESRGLVEREVAI